MTTYIYVGPTSAGLADGTSWANRYGTLNAAEDRPIVADTVVYVGPGTYRELLTCDVSGAAGQTISYVGDYDGSHTDGVGGVVRITGMNAPDQAWGARNYCIDLGARSYRTFRGFTLDGTASALVISVTPESDVTVDECYLLTPCNTIGVYVAGANQLRWAITNCHFCSASGGGCVYFYHSADVSNAGHVVQNCTFQGSRDSYGVQTANVGGITVTNCTAFETNYGYRVSAALAAGQTMAVNNCIVFGCQYGMMATVAGELVEDYNSISNCIVARSNVNVGANSNAYPFLPDSRWFHEATTGGRFITPFDMASYCALVEVADNAPTATDMRGTAVQGSEREIGALEYDSTLLIESAAGGGGMLKADKRGGKQ